MRPAAEEEKVQWARSSSRTHKVSLLLCVCACGYVLLLLVLLLLLLLLWMLALAESTERRRRHDQYVSDSGHRAGAEKQSTVLTITWGSANNNST